jgi:hypothetical protein
LKVTSGDWYRFTPCSLNGPHVRADEDYRARMGGSPRYGETPITCMATRKKNGVWLMQDVDRDGLRGTWNIREDFLLSSATEIGPGARR